MKSYVELQVALRGLRRVARGKKTQIDPVLDLWVEEALARNYWRRLCERSQAERSSRPAPTGRDDDHSVAGNAA